MDIFKIIQDGNNYILSVLGNLELDDSSKLYKALKNIADSSKNNLVVDLKACQYIDMSGLSAISQFVKEFLTNNKTVSLCNLTEECLDAIKYTLIYPSLSIFETVEECLLARV